MVDDLGLRVPEGPSARAFGFLMAGVAALVAAWLWLRGSARFDVWAGVALLLAAAAVVRPSLLDPARAAWMRLARFLAPIGNTVVLAIFFFVVLTPVAMVLRLVRRDRLGVRSPEGETYWRASETEGGDYTRPF